MYFSCHCVLSLLLHVCMCPDGTNEVCRLCAAEAHWSSLNGCAYAPFPTHHYLHVIISTCIGTNKPAAHNVCTQKQHVQRCACLDVCVGMEMDFWKVIFSLMVAFYLCNLSLKSARTV